MALSPAHHSHLKVQQAIIDVEFWQDLADLEKQICLAVCESSGHHRMCRIEEVLAMDASEITTDFERVSVIENVYYHLAENEEDDDIHEENTESYFRFFTGTHVSLKEKNPFLRFARQSLPDENTIKELAEKRDGKNDLRWKLKDNEIGQLNEMKTDQDLNEFMERLFRTDPARPNRFKEIRQERMAMKNRRVGPFDDFEEYTLELRVVIKELGSLLDAAYYAKITTAGYEHADKVVPPSERGSLGPRLYLKDPMDLDTEDQTIEEELGGGGFGS